MHGGIGVVEEVLGVQGIERIHTDPDGGRQRVLVIGNDDRARESELHALCDPLGSLRCRYAGENQAEFIAARACDAVLDGTGLRSAAAWDPA